jgi:hypothetical protein
LGKNRRKTLRSEIQEVITSLALLSLGEKIEAQRGAPVPRVYSRREKKPEPSVPWVLLLRHLSLAAADPSKTQDWDVGSF